MSQFRELNYYAVFRETPADYPSAFKIAPHQSHEDIDELLGGVNWLEVSAVSRFAAIHQFLERPRTWARRSTKILELTAK